MQHPQGAQLKDAVSVENIEKNECFILLFEEIKQSSLCLFLEDYAEIESIWTLIEL